METTANGISPFRCGLGCTCAGGRGRNRAPIARARPRHPRPSADRRVEGIGRRWNRDGTRSAGTRSARERARARPRDPAGSARRDVELLAGERVLEAAGGARAGTGARGRDRRRPRRPGSPQTGRPIASRWTRIWCVRPVSSRTLEQRPWLRASRRRSNQVTASRGVAVSSEWRVRSRRSRPIGASIRPVRERGVAAHEREVACARPRARGSAPAARRAPRSERATTQQARGVAVEAVHDPRPVVVLPALRAEREQPLHERPRSRRPGRVDDEAGRLVDDEQVLVLPDDRDVERLGLERRRAPGSRPSTSSPPSSR